MARAYARFKLGPTQAVLKLQARKERCGHLWNCCRRRAPSEKQKAQGRSSGGNCGREAVVIWCRVQGGGSSFLPLCKAHQGEPEAFMKGELSDQVRQDFQCVPVLEFDEFMRAKAVRDTLMKGGSSEPER